MPEEIVIEKRNSSMRIDFAELFAYRDMFRFLVLRSIKGRYAQAVLGMGWAILQPLFSMVVFTVVFGKLARVSSDGAPYALFSFAALVPWTFFANALQDATASLIANASMLSKVYFPRMVLPLSAVAAKLLDFLIAMVILLIMQAAYGILPNRQVLVLPLLILMMIASAAGVGMWLASLAIRYRDVSYSMAFLVQLLMYCAPVVYPASLIPNRYQLLYSLNPMVGVIEGFRAALLGTHALDWGQIGVGSATAFALAISGALYFRSRERFFADVA